MSLRHAPLAIGALAIIAVATILALGSPSHADDEQKLHTVYLSITGEGPNAKAWYHGAPPAGVFVQDALDTWSEKGYRVKEVRPYLRPVVTVISPDQGVIQQASEREEFFIIILER